MNSQFFYIKVEGIKSDFYIKFPSLEEAKKTLKDMHNTLTHKSFLHLDSEEYHCVLYKHNILGLYVIAQEGLK